VQTFAYGIVLSSTATHAYWNYLLKRSRGGSVFVGLSKVVEVVVFAPVFLWMTMRPLDWGSGAIGLIVVGAALVLLNYAALARAYQTGDLSLVYPVSRAGILVFLPLFGFLAFGERLTIMGWIALVAIVLGIVVLQLPEFSRAAITSLAPKLRSESVAFAMAAALFAAIYTVWDKNAIRTLPAFVYFYAYTAVVAAGYIAFLWRRHPRETVLAEWRANRTSIIQVGIFNTITYLLVLIALRGETSSYVIALRQLSIVWGVLLGRLLLGESVGPPKRVGVILLVLGCALVALAG
jgi:drug/metabolite transporter (DMT)-like permease